MTISRDVLDELLSGVENADDLLGDQGLMKELKVRLMERMLGAELTENLGYEPDTQPTNQQSNRRNGTSRKTLKGNNGALPIDVPRDRDGSFEPVLIKKVQTRIDGMDDKIIGLYAAGLSTRDIRSHLEEVYGLKVSADLVSRVTDAVLEEVSDWQNRALEPMYPIVFLDALRVKIRDAESRQVKNKAVYVALGVNAEGEREVLGLWIAANEGAKFWLSVMNNLRNRGVEDILIAVVDGLKGFQDAINAAFPDTTVQTCIVHLVRHSLNFCGWKDRKVVAKDLKRIYQATDDVEAEKALADFEAEWGQKYPSIAPSWRRAWQEVIPFFAFPPAVRKIIYTTNAIESLNRVIRKTTKTRGSFPTDDAATKLIYLAIRTFEKAGRCVREWVAARNQFAILYSERFNK
ncbi:MAG: IS256 family transposase [Roseobacter sp.]|uniref:IS256 family transposase n=1 Tax=Tateyamaria sp. TaxID=1929288 RepID=UPI00328B2BC8